MSRAEDVEHASFVPLDGETARALEDAASALRGARRDLDLAAQALLELAEDMKIDAVRRLAERGASAAQLARYEEAFDEAAGALRARREALEVACAQMQRAVDRVR
jgi:hypothetical protein